MAMGQPGSGLMGKNKRHRHGVGGTDTTWAIGSIWLTAWSWKVLTHTRLGY